YGIFKISSQIHKKSGLFQQNLSTLSSFTQEIFSGIRVIKAYAIEEKKQNEFNVLAKDSRNKAMDLAKTNALFGPLLILLIGLSNLIVIYVGGKAVIIGDAKTQKTPELMRRFGQFVDSLSGKYITAEDVGMETKDMDTVNEVTKYVAGISVERGGSGNPSPVTAYGVFMGMKAAAKYKYGSDNLEGKKVLVQGIGHVGEVLVQHLTESGALVTITDINEDRVNQVGAKYGTKIFTGADLYSADVDIYAPCALGATINDATINNIKATIIAGAANNQLANEAIHGKILKDKGILYAPDFLINAGGVINVYSELVKWTNAQVMEKTENIYNTALEIFKFADDNNITTHQAAFSMAQKRIDDAKNELKK
uniref:ABC transporter transmembrane domain-containing protein n=1 Tax=Flavobacterium sp. TaxID=239 RepID=UPI0040470B7A